MTINNTNDTEQLTAQMVPLSEVVRSIMIRDNDFLGTSYLRVLEFAKDVYRDLNLTAIRYTKRYYIEVNPACNCIELPCDFLLKSSVSIVDDCGHLVPLLENPNITEPLVERNLPRNCECECGCSGQLCGALKNYELIYRDVKAPLPGGGEGIFQTFSRKTIYPDGSYYLEYSEPVVKYDGDVHTSTVLETKKEFICKLAVKPCGCPIDNEDNRKVIKECCGTTYLSDECCCNPCPPEDCLSFGYRILGNRIYFDSDFPYKQVVLRYFPEPSKGDFMVPLVAKTAIIYGVKREMFPYDMGTGYRAIAATRQQQRFDFLYMAAKRQLFRTLNRISLAKFYATILPPRTL